MSVKKKGLGAGTGLGKRLEALGLTESHLDDGRKSALEIKVTDIVPNPRQARKIFHKEALQALADSISQYGIVQPDNPNTNQPSTLQPYDDSYNQDHFRPQKYLD